MDTVLSVDRKYSWWMDLCINGQNKKDLNVLKETAGDSFSHRIKTIYHEDNIKSKKKQDGEDEDIAIENV